jgi:Domain of unknown function (DUF5615)
MRVLLDEHVPIQMIDLLDHLLRGHDVTHVNAIRWRAKHDDYLIVDAAGRGFDVFVTNDRNQLSDPGELKTIKKSGIHHVRYTQRTKLGLRGLGLAMGALTAAMPMVIETLAAASGQRLVHITAIGHLPSDRFQTVDPHTTPPPYWPGRGN